MIDSLLDITREASEIILEIYHRAEGFDVSQKEDRTQVTEADLAAHHQIVDRLRELAPEIPIISEESGVPPMEERAEWERFYLVDPLDGTKEFISRNGEFTINIALIEHGVPVLGIVGVPVMDTIYYGSREEGSYRISGTAEPERLFSRVFTPPGVADIVVSRSHGDDKTADLLRNLGIEIGKSVSSGSSLKFCRVAEGVAHLYPRLGPTLEWDTAAGDAVWRWSVESDPLKPRWSPLRYNKPTLKNEAFILGLAEPDHPVQISL